MNALKCYSWHCPPVAHDREVLGRIVRRAWVEWAREQPNPKASWLVPYEELSEADKDADCRIGEAVQQFIVDASLQAWKRAQPEGQTPASEREKLANELNFCAALFVAGQTPTGIVDTLQRAAAAVGAQPERPRVLAQDVRDVADAIAAGCRDIDQQRDADTLRRAAWEMEREGPRVTLERLEDAIGAALPSSLTEEQHYGVMAKVALKLVESGIVKVSRP